MSESTTAALAQSVKQRLQNRANQQGETLNALLIRYGIERMLYRLVQSRHGGNFILKGATLFAVWTGSPHRPTQDVDLLGFGDPSTDRLTIIFREICAATVEPDGLSFDAQTIRAAPIREESVYDGIRVQILAMLGMARIPLQIDVGFGDVVTPAPRELAMEPLLDLPAPVLRTYPPETVVAEKLDAIINLGMANSRMKDYFDLWTLSRTMTFGLKVMHEAVRATLTRRGTTFPDEPPIGLTRTFSADAAKRAQWAGFLRKMKANTSGPGLEEVVSGDAEFLAPAINAIHRPSVSDASWPPRGPWRST